MMALPCIELLTPSNWPDYELLDSGDGAKLERFGSYTLVRPERSALWKRTLSKERWHDVHASFEQLEGGEGRWRHLRPLPERWPMRYGVLSFWARLTPFRHTGVFPEQAAQWDWIVRQIGAAKRPVSVLNLFGYTGIASLAAASAGASVTQVDASKPALTWGRENAIASSLENHPIRWIPDDALKFVRREARRGRRYDGLIIDPPVFGRGPKGEVWRFGKSFPDLLQACQDVLATQPLFIVVTAYAVEERCLTLYNLLADCTEGYRGQLAAGELILVDSAAKRPLSMSIYARWSGLER